MDTGKISLYKSETKITYERLMTLNVGLPSLIRVHPD